MKAFPSAFTAPRTQLPIVSKYRRKIGIDVAVEALTEALRQKRSQPSMKFTDSRKCVAATASYGGISKRSYEAEDSLEHRGIASGKTAEPRSVRWRGFQFFHGRWRTPTDRHTFASDMIRAGVSLPALMQLMGHAQIQTTMVYLQLTPQDVREQYARAVAQLIRPTPPSQL